MRSEAGYENSLHSDLRSCTPGLPCNTFPPWSRGGIRCMERQRERGKKWNQIRTAEEDTERGCRRTEVVDWVPPEILLFRLFYISLLSLAPLLLPPSFLTSEVDYNRDPGLHLWLKPRTYGAARMFEHALQCSRIPLRSSSVGQIYFLVRCLLLGYQRTIVCWSARVLQVTHRPWMRVLHLSSTSHCLISLCFFWPFKICQSYHRKSQEQRIWSSTGSLL